MASSRINERQLTELFGLLRSVKDWGDLERRLAVAVRRNATATAARDGFANSSGNGATGLPSREQARAHAEGRRVPSQGVTLVDPVLETVALMQPGDDGEIDLLATLLRRPAWMAEGACTDDPTERFFARTASKPEAWALVACGRCPVRSTCLEFALEHDEAGIWGGTTETDRRRLLSQEGTTWAELGTDRRNALLAAALILRDAVQPPSTTCETVEAPTPCEHCGDPTSRRFCDQRCRSAASYYRRRAAPCEFCGGVTPKQYCSPECRVGAWERRQAERVSA